MRYWQLSPYGMVERINVSSITKSIQLVVIPCMINSSKVGKTLFFFPQLMHGGVCVHWGGGVVINRENSVLGCWVIIDLFSSKVFYCIFFKLFKLTQCTVIFKMNVSSPR